MKIKVSNVCQLVPKFNRTGTDRGVTFTYSGDGSCTINGTPTGEYYSLSTITLDIKSIKPNHKYVVYDVKKDPIISELIIANYQGGYIFKGIGNIFTFPEHPYTRFVFEIRVNLNHTANNIVVRPQLFDLTEMYGAGNEPTTVEQFRQDFPNEMYEYSPECWKRCKELKYVTETKNLFDKSKADIISREYYFTPNQGAGSNFYVMTVKPGITYTVSYERFIKSDDTGAPNALELSVQTGTHYKDGTQLFFRVGNGERGVWVKRSGQFTVPSDINQVTFSGLKDRFLYRNFMVQEGTTATPYQPYGYLPLRTGRYRTETRNLFDINAEMHNVNKPEYYIEVMGNIVKTNYDISHVGHPYIEVPVEIGETYTFSCNAYRSSDIINVYSRVRYPDNTVVTYIGNGPVNKTFTATQSSIQVCFGIDTYGTWDTSQFALIYDIQLEKGTTATHYQPYKHIYFH